uniref:SP-RING-type domain-containing protein n=2 Tax=Rhodnius prolixus TaxID=13249 RepID=T1HYI9_RHOPR
MNMIKIHRAFYENCLFEFLNPIIPPTLLTQMSGLSMFRMTLDIHLANAIGLGRELNNSDPQLSSDYIYNVKILLRMCKVDGGVYNMDKYPKNVTIKVNDENVNIMKGTLTDITPYVKINPSFENIIKVFNSKFEKSFYLLTVFLAKTLDFNIIIKNLLSNKIRSEEYTQNKITELLNKEESELELTSMEISLKCPFSQTIMVNPCQSVHCNHLECFEAVCYIKVNIANGKWICPICKIHAPPTNLVIDGYLLNALKIIPKDCICLILNKDGTCIPRKENNLCFNDLDEIKDVND